MYGPYSEYGLGAPIIGMDSRLDCPLKSFPLLVKLSIARSTSRTRSASRLRAPYDSDLARHEVGCVWGQRARIEAREAKEHQIMLRDCPIWFGRAHTIKLQPESRRILALHHRPGT